MVTTNAGVTVASLINVSWALALHAHTGRDDIVFGITTSGLAMHLCYAILNIPQTYICCLCVSIIHELTQAAGRSGLHGEENTIGLLISTLPLRVAIQQNLRIDQFISQVHASYCAMLVHEGTPLQKISDWTGVGPLFDVAVFIENYPDDEVTCRHT